MAKSKVQRFVRSDNAATTLKVGLTVAAFAVATYSNVLGRRISEARAVQLADDSVPDDVAAAIRRQSVLRWVMPALSGTLMLIGALDNGGRRSPSRVSRAIDRFSPDFDNFSTDRIAEKLPTDRIAPVLDRIGPALEPVLDRIGPALERITPDWVDEHRLPSLAS